MSNPQQVNNRQELCRDDEIDLFDRLNSLEMAAFYRCCNFEWFIHRFRVHIIAN